jgi:hypothetical protein
MDQSRSWQRRGDTWEQILAKNLHAYDQFADQGENERMILIYIVVYSIKAGIVESQQSAVTRRRPVNNNREIVTFTLTVPMAVHAIMEYGMPPLSNNYTATEERCFLHGPCRDLISRAVIQPMACSEDS